MFPLKCCFELKRDCEQLVESILADKCYILKQLQHQHCYFLPVVWEVKIERLKQRDHLRLDPWDGISDC